MVVVDNLDLQRAGFGRTNLLNATRDGVHIMYLTVLTYNATVLHGERSFEPDRWCQHDGWLKRDPSGGDDAANFAFWWGDSATSPIVGPIIKRASAAGASAPGHGAKRATAARATKADYAKLTELASTVESPTDEMLKQVLRTLDRPLTLEQSRRCQSGSIGLTARDHPKLKSNM